MTALAQIRRRSGMRNVDFDINRVPEPFEAFVHHVRMANHGPIEVHFPIEWVSIGTDDETVFSAEARDAISYAQQLADRYA